MLLLRQELRPSVWITPVGNWSKAYVIPVFANSRRANQPRRSMKFPSDSIIGHRKLKDYLLTPRVEDGKSGFLSIPDIR
jgi:hypothetical protein